MSYEPSPIPVHSELQSQRLLTPEPRSAEDITYTLTNPDGNENRAPHSLTATEHGSPPSFQAHDGYLGHYEILREIGQGGMGRVLLARDTKLGRLVAIKLLLEGGENAARTLAEARATARAQHENIVVIYEVGTFEGQPFMVLEYVEGRTLRQVLRDALDSTGKALPRGLALELVTPVLRALSAAHKNGIVHRDLKPENIMLLDSGRVKVLDFGIARFVDSTAPRTREGTLPYMSPEQWAGDELDERSDLWAVGIMLYELLVGEHPLGPLSLDRLAQVSDLHTPMPSLRDARPELADLSDVIARCLRKPRQERFASADELLAALEPFLARSRFAHAGAAERPFAGLTAFQESDGDRFFGRSRDVTAVLSLLERQPLLVVAGASGAGKSSFVRAGLIPALRHSGETWEALVMRPGGAPLSALTRALEPTELEVDLKASPAQFGAALRARARSGSARPQRGRILVFVDQFEELYTLTKDPAEREAFLRCLLGAADDASSPLRVVASIRADFLDRLVEDRAFFAHVASGLFFLPPMDAEGRREALTRPVEAAGYRFESERMVTRILSELSRATNPLPLLQFAATKLWDARDPERKVLTLEAFEQMGGVGGALAMHADSVVSGLSEQAQKLCRAIFLHLVTPERTRAVVAHRELVMLGEDAEAAHDLVHTLATARLLLVDSDAERGSAKVEIVHESLIERWPLLAQWLDESAEDTRFLARLRAAAKEWSASGEPTGMLWRDRAAEEARAFYERNEQDRAKAKGALLGALELRYLKAVLALALRSRRSRNRLIAAAFAGVCAAAGIVLMFGLAARREAKRADEEAAHVRNQNAELAAQALRGRNATRVLAARKNEGDPTLALVILREIEPPDLPRDWPELVSAALSSGVAADVWRTSPDRCAYSAMPSPDGKLIAVAMDDSTTRILGADLVERVTLKGHEKLVWTVDWSPDSKRVLTSSNDNTARLWSADGQGEPLVLRGHRDTLNGAVMSPDGERALTASDDKTARIWSARDGREILVLGHEAEVNGVDWSPSGDRVVTASSDGIARVFRSDGKGAPLLLRGHTGMLVAVSFSPDGTRIATGGRDRTVRVWDAQSGAELLALTGHEEKILSVAFSPDGQHISSTSKDKTARIWRSDGKGAPVVLRGHDHWVYTALWSRDGDAVLTTSLDGTQRRYRLHDIVAPTLLRGHDDTVRGLVFSPDGERIATASTDGTARLWNADGSGEPKVLHGHKAAVRMLRMSPDGARLATLSSDKTARIWPLDTAAEPLVLQSPNNEFAYVDWKPNGEELVTATLDGTFQRWSKNGQELGRIEKKTSTAFKWIRVIYNHTGNRVLVVDTSDSQVYVWDLDAGAGLKPVGDLGGPVRMATWSPDGSQILGVSTPGLAKLWDAKLSAAPIELAARKIIRNGFFSPDGRRILLTLIDGTILPFREGTLGEPIATGVPEEGAVEASFSADGERILTCAPYGKVRVRYADGRGAPFVLQGSPLALASGYFSPKGNRIGLHYEDKFAWVWPDVLPFSGVDDARLWTVTSYCLPPDKRIELFGIGEAEAREQEAACKARVARVGKEGAALH